MKDITVVTPCYNEEDNLDEIYLQVRSVMEGINGVRYHHLFIDNRSTDRSADILRRLATEPDVVVVRADDEAFRVGTSYVFISLYYIIEPRVAFLLRESWLVGISA